MRFVLAFILPLLLCGQAPTPLPPPAMVPNLGDMVPSKATTSVNAGCAQGATYVAALSGLSGTETAAYKAAICGMVADNTWSLIQGLYIHANASAANARVNAANPGTFNETGHGSCTFTADVGFSGDGSTCYNDTGFTPSTNGGGVMTQNSATFGVCVLNNRAANASTAYGGIDGSGNSTYFLTYFSTIHGGAINDAGSDFLNGVSGSAGSWVFTRTSPSVTTVYSNGVAQTTAQGAGSTGLPAVSLAELARNNNGTVDSFTSDQQAYFFFGGGMSAGQVASVYARLGTMLTALGVGGGCSNNFASTPVYFDSVAGSDLNNCSATGTPCLTVGKMNALLYAGGATINLKGGSSFTGCLSLSTANVHSTSAGSPITIQQYSTGAAPIITSNCGGANSGGSGPKTAAITIDSISATINGISVRGSGFTAGSATQYGIAIQNSSGSGTPKTVIENTDVQGFGVVGLNSDQGTDIFVSGFSEAAGFPAACGAVNVTLLNNTIHGTSTTSGDNNGITGTGCGNNVTEVVQGEIIANISGIANGVQGAQGNPAILNGSGAGSVIKFTLAHDFGGNTNTCGGPSGLWSFASASSLIQFNEVYNGLQSGGPPGAGPCDWSAYDFDNNTTGGTGEYLYSHNNGGPGFVIYGANGSNVFRYGISENDATYTIDDGGSAFALGSVGNAWAAYNLTLYVTGTTTQSTPSSCASFGFSGTFSSGMFSNNACQNSATDTFNRTYMLNGNNGPTGENNLAMVNNNYNQTGGGVLTFASGWNGSTTYATLALFQSGTGLEANSKTVASGFNSPPSGTCTWTPSSQSTWPPSGCPAAYSTIASGLKSAGANLASSLPAYFTAPFPTADAGSRDYYANTIPGTGACFNMGAFGTCP